MVVLVQGWAKEATAALVAGALSSSWIVEQKQLMSAVAVAGTEAVAAVAAAIAVWCGPQDRAGCRNHARHQAQAKRGVMAGPNGE